MTRGKTMKPLKCIAMMVVAAPFILGTTCPLFPGTGTLLNQQLPANLAATGENDICATAASALQTTFQADANKAVTATVTGPASNSRPQIRILDNNNQPVANSGTGPTSRTTTATFTPSASLTFTLQVFECAGAVAGNYDIQVVQAPF